MTETWMHAMLGAVDSMDASAFAAFFDAEGRMKYANGEFVVGPDGVRDFTNGFYQAIKGIRHRIVGTWELDGRTFCQGECTYTRRDDRAVTLPFFSITRRNGEKVAEYQVFMDANPVFA